ncbi:hypothetical protein PPERSA_00063 [Pseudocohnilembus persalinus]|uniref:TECPR1-like DysF domain-containing protein n=1 Tax=Pseudocohnilembus persalinus TaxID=266149 RepID=A0A0V0QYC2_PSEPJ|nr:hypothetical protein PPERSA_00063 [Pseudocohnilembus persalinus]|eukprot:KRX07153.1 hypothetical protein PPERSA_00063 [Pseudocohnilembus persalinus]
MKKNIYINIGWNYNMLPGDSPVWSDKYGKIKLDKSQFKLPDNVYWDWKSNWQLETSENTDGCGWQYIGVNKVKNYPSFSAYLRRRKWTRTCFKVENIDLQTNCNLENHQRSNKKIN